MPETITAYCPECQTRFVLQPELAGKRMRCANPDCREVFEVAPLEEVAAAAPARNSPEGSPPAPTYDWQSAPPPVQSEQADAPAPSATPPAEDRQARNLFAPPPSRRSNTPLLIGLAGVVLGTIALGGYLLVDKIGRAEERRVELARKAYVDGRFPQAASAYDDLAKEYGGARAPEYRFMAGLAAARDAANRVPPEPEPALAAIEAFLTEQTKSPWLAANKADIVDTLQKDFADLGTELGERLGAPTPDVAAAGVALERLRTALGLLEQMVATTEAVVGPRAKVEELSARFATVKAKYAGKAEALTLLKRPRPDIAGARELLRRSNAGDDPALKAALTNAIAAIAAAATFTAEDRPPQPALNRTVITGILPDPKGPAGNGARVLVQAKGLLVGVEATTGRVAWADRVGIDATVPPVRLPTDADEPPQWLVVSSEPPGTSCRNADGATRWFQPLEAMPIAAPVLIGQRAFLALNGSEGRIAAFDTRTGKRTGTFQCGELLSGGIAARPGTSWLYAPAVAQYVFALETAPDDGTPRCAGLVLTEHSPGSICCPPKFAVGSLLLCLAEGPAESAVSVYRADATPTPALTAQLRIAGWPTTPPEVEGERLIAVSDLGGVGVYGLRQPGALDPPVYPLAVRDGQSSTPWRCEVVHADESGILVLSQGRLTPWRLGVDRQRGRALAAAPSIADHLGSPVQPAIEVGDTVILVTVRADPANTLFTLIHRPTGEVTTYPIGLGPDSTLVAANDGVRAIDSQGGIIGLEPPGPIDAWQFGGKELARPLTGSTGRTQVVGSWAVVPRDKSVVLRPLAGGVDRAVELAAPLAGTPAHAADWIFPLANGSLVRVADGDSRPVAGPTWRSPAAPPDAHGQVVHWFDKTYLVTDGDRRLTRLRWSGDRDFELATSSALQRPHRIRGVPVVLPERRAAIADEGGLVTVVRGALLQVERTWKLGTDEKHITSGPTLVGDRLAVVLGGRELVWLDPNVDRPAWTFSPPEASLVGMPVTWKGKLAVADSLARIWLLDLTNGKPVERDPKPLPAAIAGSPAVVGDRLLVPLDDGTLVALPQ